MSTEDIAAGPIEFMVHGIDGIKYLQGPPEQVYFAYANQLPINIDGVLYRVIEIKLFANGSEKTITLHAAPTITLEKD
jgi:hypothetical protein